MITSPSLPRRFAVLDTYRFFAAFGVVIYHFSHPWAPPGFDSIPLLTEFRLFVDFFFALSGFVIMHTYAQRMAGWSDYLVFLKKRLARVYPLHLMMLLIYAGLGLVLYAGGYRFTQPEYLAPSAFIPNLLLIHAWGVTDHMSFNTPSWSISAEMFVYLLFPAFLFVIRKTGATGALVTAVYIALLIHVVRETYGFRHWTEATYDAGMLRAVPMFLAGMGIHTLVAGSLRNWQIPWPVAHGCAGMTLLLMLIHAPPEIILIGCASSVLFLALAEKNDPSSRLGQPFWVHLGDASYAVYMIHPFVGTIIFTTAPRFFHLSEGWRLPLVMLAGCVVVFIAPFIYRWFEDPMRRWLGR